MGLFASADSTRRVEIDNYDAVGSAKSLHLIDICLITDGPEVRDKEHHWIIIDINTGFISCGQCHFETVLQSLILVDPIGTTSPAAYSDP
jgi:hypothetical protein